MDCEQNKIAEARIQEATARHMDLMIRMMRIDDALARRTMASVIQADPAMTFAQAVGEVAMLLRHQADQTPCHKETSGRDLRPVIAYTLDLIGLRYPERERFRSRFHFAINGDAPPGYGRGSMEFAAWKFERTFADRAGMIAPGFKEDAINRIATALNRPLPVLFFDLIRTDVAMATLGIRLYCEVANENPASRLVTLWRSFHPDTIEHAKADADQAMVMVDEYLLDTNRPQTSIPHA